MNKGEQSCSRLVRVDLCMEVHTLGPCGKPITPGGPSGPWGPGSPGAPGAPYVLKGRVKFYCNIQRILTCPPGVPGTPSAPSSP